MICSLFSALCQGIPALFVVLFTTDDSHSPVELFRKDEAHELVGKGKVGEGQDKVGPADHRRAQA
jgi:hypothetical protein